MKMKKSALAILLISGLVLAGASTVSAFGSDYDTGTDDGDYADSPYESESDASDDEDSDEQDTDSDYDTGTNEDEYADSGSDSDASSNEDERSTDSDFGNDYDTGTDKDDYADSPYEPEDEEDESNDEDSDDDERSTDSDFGNDYDTGTDKDDYADSPYEPMKDLEAAISYSPEHPEAKETITFSGEDSEPSDSIESYDWDFDDDGEYEASGEEVTHEYDTDGERDVTLKVTNENGGSDTETETIDVLKEKTDTTRSGQGGGGGGGGDDSDDDNEDDNDDDEEEGPSEPDFQVDIDSPSSGDEFKPGDKVDVDYKVENTGDQEETQDVVFNVDGSEEASKDVDLDGGSSYSGTFEWNTDGLDEDTYELEVASDDDDEMVDVTLDEDAGDNDDDDRDDNDDDDSDDDNDDSDDGDDSDGGGGGGGTVIADPRSDVSIDADPSSLTIGDSTQVFGEATGDTVEILFNGERVDELEVENDEYETSITPEETGEHELTARSDGEEASTTIDVSSSVEITSMEASETVNSEEEFEVCVETDSPTTPEIELFANGELEETITEDDHCFEQTIEDEALTEYRAVATVDGDSDEESATVLLEDDPGSGPDDPDDDGSSFTGDFLQSPSNLLMSVLAGLLAAAGLLYRQGVTTADLSNAVSSLRVWAHNEKEGFLIFTRMIKSTLVSN